MAKSFLVTLLLVALLFPFLVVSQSFKDVYLDAEDYIEDGNYYKALEKYQELLEQDPNNANLNFKIGYCFLHTATQKVNAIPFLEYAVNYISDDYQSIDIDETRAPIEAKYYLGKAYHVNYRFDDAERMFLDLKKQLKSDEKEFEKLIDYELSACQVARQLVKSPVEMTVTNLGRNVNSTFDEHSPVISGDESLLIFTSKRVGNVGEDQMDDGQYFEDIYLCSFDGKKYTQAKPISGNINTPDHEASIGLSFDGSKLFIYRDDAGDGNIYVSDRNGTEWLTPEKLPAVINSKYRETHASMSFDQREIYFTSDRKGGYGGLDIYRVRKLPNGNWSKAQNMGPTINTEYDEEGPYLHPDGTSLFFASRGHQNMGGFDIFVSFTDGNDKWSVPQNVGYPINTPDDNIYYVPSVDGRRAYYASYANNSIGLYDIFRIDLSETHVRNQTVIAGIAIDENGVYLKNAIITISNDDDVVGIYTPDPKNGKFLLILPRGKRFHALIESENHPDMEFYLEVPEFSYDQRKQVIVFNDVVTAINKPAKLADSKVISEISKNETTEDSLNVIGSTDFEIEKNVEESSVLASSEFTESTSYNEKIALEDNSTSMDSLGSDKNNQNDISEEGDMHEANMKKEKKNAERLASTNFKMDESNNLGTTWYLLIGLLASLVVIVFIRQRLKRN